MWTKIKELEETRTALVVEARELLKKQQDEKRQLTSDEAARFDAIEKQATEIGADIDRLKRGEALERQLPQSLVLPRPDLPGSTRAAANIVGIGREQRMSDVLGVRPTDRKLSLGRIVRGLATGDWADASAELRALNEGSAAAGGVMVPLPISTEIIDLARAKSVVIQAGARTIPMTSSTLKVPRVVSDPGIGWKAENADFASTDAVFEPVTLSAKTLGGVARMSIELAEDVAELDAVLYSLLSSAIAVELDRAALRGTGSDNQPEGILETSGILTQAGSAVDDYVDFARAITKVKAVNGNPNAVIVTPQTWGDLAAMVDGTGHPIDMPKALESLSWHDTSSLPSDGGVGDNESTAIVGAFENLWIGARTNLHFEVSRVEGTAFAKGQVSVRCYLRGDVLVSRPNHFCAISGLTSPT